MKKIRNGILAGLALLLAGSCAEKRIVSGPIDRTRLFPPGVYHQSVRISIPSQNKSFRLEGVVAIRPETIRLFALSSFGTTVFRIQDDLARNEVATEIYVDDLKKHEKSIREFYGVVRVLLISFPRESAKEPYRVTIGREIASLEIKEFDQNGIPERILITHPRFSADIRVTGYEI